jgi:DNA-directed RNA polymerase subunit RPC12/RpoP
MTIVRCSRCRIVILDSNEDGEREVKCPECGAEFRIKLEEGDVVRFEGVDKITKHKEP